ncbi:MAG: hypothetical protein HDS79_01365 [Bacteroidales bacterium]|nr:hypothetical protein [Bacteroidales bacterium]
MKRDGIRNVMGVLAGILSVLESIVKAIRVWKSDRPEGSAFPDKTETRDKSDCH